MCVAGDLVLQCQNASSEEWHECLREQSVHCLGPLPDLLHKADIDVTHRWTIRLHQLWVVGRAMTRNSGVMYTCYAQSYTYYVRTRWVY